jgi:hypothetical protein
MQPSKTVCWRGSAQSRAWSWNASAGMCPNALRIQFVLGAPSRIHYSSVSSTGLRIGPYPWQAFFTADFAALTSPPDQMMNKAATRMVRAGWRGASQCQGARRCPDCGCAFYSVGSAVADKVETKFVNWTNDASPDCPPRQPISRRGAYVARRYRTATTKTDCALMSSVYPG